MSSSIAPDIKELTWEQARVKVAPLNPEFSQIIDRIAPDDRHTLFEVEYKFGDNMLKKNSKFLIPYNNNLLPISDNSLPKKLKAKLNYNFESNPVGMVVNNTFELFIEIDHRIIPFGIIPPGKVFGSWRIPRRSN